MKNRIFVKVYKFLFFSWNISKNVSKNLSNKYSQRNFIHTKQSATDALKTVSKEAI